LAGILTKKPIPKISSIENIDIQVFKNFLDLAVLFEKVKTP